MRKIGQEHRKKITNSYIKTRDEKEISKQKLINKIKDETKELLLPTLKQKMIETTELIVKVLKEKGSYTNNIQIMSMIAQGSLLEVATGGYISYTAQEIKIAFNLYLQMINRINEIKPFPPTIESFTSFIGISRNTYNNWLVDPDRKDVMDYIHSYLLGVLATSTLTGEIKEISGIYLQKTMGKVEQVQPIIVEHKKATDIDSITAQLQALKKDKIIEADYSEVEKV